MKNWIYTLSIFLTLLGSVKGQDTFIYYNPQDSTYTFEDWEAHWMQKVIEEHKIQKDELWKLYPYIDMYEQDSVYIKDLESQVIVLDSLLSNYKDKLVVTQSLYEECLVLKKNAEDKVMPQGTETVEALTKETLKQKKRKRFFLGTTIGAGILAIIEAFVIAAIAY